MTQGPQPAPLPLVLCGKLSLCQDGQGLNTVAHINTLTCKLRQKYTLKKLHECYIEITDINNPVLTLA